MEKKNNLSFLLDFDLNNIDSNASSDSDTVGLLIDVSQVDNFNNAEKFRRQDDDTGFINEMEEEIERQLDAKAAKTNLTATNVKNILKHVISNEHVMAMVHNRLTRGEDDFIFEPKLTRAKAKELARIQPHISSTKKNTSAVHKLIQKEFSDDSSDEEYYPDQQSDDDKDGDNILDSDMDSQPSTPSMPQNISTLEQMDTSDLQYDNEGIFKIPSIPNALNEEESIGHRTRSKLCLSKTPLEQLEQAFIPPDITTDMYDWDWEPEDEYINFLKELYTQPLQKEINIEDDPEADPEYNILEDEETNTLDKEELREDKAVKISKKELKTLIAELDQFANNYTKEQQQQQLQKAPKKKKPSENSFVPLGDTSSGNPMIHLLPVLAEPKLPEFVSQSQCYLLSVQISQHVQLMAQQFVMTYKHPNFHKFSNICKNNLNSLSILAEKSNSKFIPQNFDDALKLITDWESKLSEPSFLKSYIKYIECETEYEKFAFNKKKKYSPTFHPELIKLMINSKALMYPKLLPQSFPSSLLSNGHQQYTPSEESLIVIGLEQFLPYVKSLCKKYSRDCDIFADAVKEVQKYLLPTKQVSGLIHYIKRCKLSKKNNLIKQFFDNGHVPKVNYCLLKKYELLPPINYPLNSLPLMWQNFIKNRDMLEEHVSLLKPNRLNMIDHKKFTLISQSKSLNHVNHHFRNPIINMLRHMPSLISPQKSETCSSSSNDSSIKNGIKSESDTVYNGNEQSCETTEFESMPTRLRMTTPRLAKIKSAQTNKTNEQTESAKGSSQRKIYSFDNNREKATSFSLRDNEDEIAELMLASTTIKKNTTNRKKTKQARELENLKKLLEAENSINKNERATKFAASFIQKVHVKLESKDPELFKAVLKIFLDYSEKLENPSQGDRTDYCLDERSPPFDKNSGQVMNQLNKYRDTVSVDLYKVICKKLHEYPDLCSDFLLFLTPQQASLIDKSVEHTMMLKMKEFVYITQMYFAKQPSRIAKVMQAMTQMASDPCITVANAHATMGIALKGHPLIMDMFLQILPTGKPPERY